MLNILIDNLSKDEKLLYFEVAINPILTQILNAQKESLKEYILNTSKKENQSSEDFILQQERYRTELRFIENFLSSNNDLVKQVQE